MGGKIVEIWSLDLTPVLTQVTVVDSELVAIVYCIHELLE